MSFDAKKITIVGLPGSGKSFLARMLADKLGLPLYHMDDYFRKFGDREDRKAIILETMEKWTKGDLWIIDGNWPRQEQANKIRFERADVVIYMNIPKSVCIESAKLRAQEQNSTQSEIDKFVKYIENYENLLPDIKLQLAKYANGKLLELNSREQVNEFIRRKI